MWFQQDDAFDAQIKVRFGAVFARACRGELAPWRTTPMGRLAEIICLDQFSRNLYRDDPRAYDQDAMALALAQEAVHTGAHWGLSVTQRWVLYMPFMHSESLWVHEHYSLPLFRALNLPEVWPHAQEHYETLKRHGCYPQRARRSD